MNEEETNIMFNIFMSSEKMTMQEEELKKLLQCSMSIPYLIERLARTNVSERDAFQISFNYLVGNFRGNYTDIKAEVFRNLNTQPPIEVMQRFIESKGNWQQILNYIMIHAKQKKLEALKDSDTLQVPLELNPTTLDIYANALESPLGNRVGILVPQIPETNYWNFSQDLGFSRINRILSRRIWDVRNSKRFQMFGVDSRKMALWTKAPNRYVKTYSSKETFDISAERIELQEMFDELKIQSSVSQSGSLYLHAHEHHGSINPLLAGLAIESLLQEHGIMYVVRNDIAGKSYYYDPEQEGIIEFQSS
jgi:hypothetical protein